MENDEKSLEIIDEHTNANDNWDIKSNPADSIAHKKSVHEL